MSKRISGQMRVLDKSSKEEGQFVVQGTGAGRMKSLIPTPEENANKGHAKQISRRGKGEGDKGEVHQQGSDLDGGSSFVEPFAHFSVGFEASRVEDIRNVGGLRNKQRHGRNIRVPPRQGGNDSSGSPMAAKPESRPPKKGDSDMKKSQSKKAKTKRMRKTEQDQSKKLHNDIQDNAVRY